MGQKYTEIGEKSDELYSAGRRSSCFGTCCLAMDRVNISPKVWIPLRVLGKQGGLAKPDRKLKRDLYSASI